MTTIGDLFKITQGTADSFENYYDIIDKCVLNVCAHVCGSTNRNGINGFVEPHMDDVVVQPLAITVCKKGDGGVTYATVQQTPFITLKHVIILEPRKDKFVLHAIDINTETLSVISSYVRKEKWRYSFGREFGKVNLQEIELDLAHIKKLAAKL